MKKLTPVLVVDRIEPLLPLWERLGFTRMVEVPQGDSLGFVILQSGSVEVMYQTVESVRGDEPKILERQPGITALYLEVDNLDDVVAKLPRETDIVVARRK